MDATALTPVLLLAFGDWVAVATKAKRWEYFFKPATLSALLALALRTAVEAPSRQGTFTVLALIFSLMGDVFLMLPRDLFLQGLASFLVAHICYVVAFAPAISGNGPDAAFATLAAALIGVLAISALILRFILRSLEPATRRKMRGPLIAYMVCIGAMVAAAISTTADPAFPATAAASAVAGALLFYISDALIGWNRFVKSYAWAPLVIIVTYHLGQMELVLALSRPGP